MEYALKFTDQEMGVLNMALGEIPHKFAAPLIQSINRQIALAQEKSDENGVPEKDDTSSE